MTQTLIKPKVAQKIKRSPNPEDSLTGYKDYIALAYAGDIVSRPTRPSFTGTIGAKEYVTAVAATPAEAFGTELIWGKLEVVPGSVDINNSPAGDLHETTAQKTEITIKLIDNDDNVGYLNLIASAPLDVVVEKNSGKMVWCGDADKNVYLKEWKKETGDEKGLITATFMFKSLRPLTLPSGVVLNYGV